jgi:hypothetical protein
MASAQEFRWLQLKNGKFARSPEGPKGSWSSDANVIRKSDVQNGPNAVLGANRHFLQTPALRFRT